MACDLHRLFGEAARATPNNEEEYRVFTAATLPTAPSELSTDRLYIKKGVHEYELEGEGGFRGVGIQSAEVRLYLPGHLAWEVNNWPHE